MKNKNTKIPIYKNKKLYMWSGIVVGVYLLSLFVPYVSNYTRYPIYLVKCGHPPVIASTFMAGKFYQTPRGASYSVGFADNFYCTTDEARSAGYPPGLGEKE